MIEGSGIFNPAEAAGILDAYGVPASENGLFYSLSQRIEIACETAANLADANNEQAKLLGTLLSTLFAWLLYGGAIPAELTPNDLQPHDMLKLVSEVLKPMKEEFLRANPAIAKQAAEAEAARVANRAPRSPLLR